MSTTHNLLLWQDDSADTAAPLTSPFEDWCEAMHVHPETPGAWECYVQGAA